MNYQQPPPCTDSWSYFPEQQNQSVDAPEPPDYAAATREGIETDISTLPSRLLTERAAAQGLKIYRTADGRYSLEPAAAAPAQLATYRAEYDRLLTAGTLTPRHRERNGGGVLGSLLDPLGNAILDNNDDPERQGPPSFEQWLEDSAITRPNEAAAMREALNYTRTQATELSADFTGLGDQERIAQDITNQQQLWQGGADIARNLERDRVKDMLELLPQYNSMNLEQQKAAYDAALDATEEGERRRLNLELEMRPEFTESELTAQDSAYRRALQSYRDENPEASAAKQALVQQLLEGIQGPGAAGAGARRHEDFDATAYGEGNADLLQYYEGNKDMLRGLDPAAPNASWQSDDLQEFLTNHARLAGVGEGRAGAGRMVDDPNADEHPDDYLTPAQRRRVEQNMRGAAAARGNILGPAAGVDEALAVSGYGEQLQAGKQAQLMQFLGQEQGLMPNFGSGSYSPNIPAFSATTGGGPNLSPLNVQRTSPWNITNANAGAMGVNQANTRFDQQMQVASMPNPWMEGLGMVAGAAGGVAGAFI